MKTNKTDKYYIVAGESSGDLHGAHLISSILSLNKNSQFFGLGGKKMVAAGLNQPLVSIDRLAIMGFFEVIKHLLFFVSLQKKIVKQIKQIRPKNPTWNYKNSVGVGGQAKGEGR